jgi:hypothetical protein
MIDVKQAIKNAKDYARDVLNTEDLLLEEVSSDDDAFEITLSLPRRTGAAYIEIRWSLTFPIVSSRHSGC